MLRDLIQKAEQGSTDAQYELGRLYRSEQLYKYAFHWLLKAVKQGHSGAQNAELRCSCCAGRKLPGKDTLPPKTRWTRCFIRSKKHGKLIIRLSIKC